MIDVKPQPSSKVGVIELIAAMVLSGTIGAFVLESGASPGTVVFFRCVFGAVALAIYCAVRGFFSGSGMNAAKLGLAALGGVFIVYNWTLLFAAYGSTSISVATVVYHTQPFYVLILGALILRERITLNKWAWIVVAFVGVILVSGLTSGHLLGDTQYMIGIGYALGAAVLYAVATIIAKRLSGVRPHIIALVQCVVGIPLLAPFITYSELGDLGAGWLWLIGLGVIHTCVMYILMYSSYQKLPTPMIAVLGFVYPVVAVIVDTTLFGTRITLLQVLGMILIVGASLAVSFNVGGRRKATSEAKADAAAAPLEAPAATR
ncbi:DMT family transporter [Rhodococcus fascians]|nr:DMT family transporter [Rhodococcus fascians]MBY4396393.1 DMT family transporter [Rhodococcus fascians]MBY4409045.1 DMT family transporter [Rhodococcus fascians]MBY4420929.1 DMT family transporter [Rhodococcus fascians]MBY4460248.1 DMT family transporter [Rhodococcus fascians]